MTVHANGWSGTHEAELEVTIQYPRIRGIITLVEVISIFVVLDFLFGALLLFFFPPRRPTFVPSLFCSVLIVSFTWYLWFTVRNIESVFTTFRISPMQLVVENSRYGVLTLNWAELTGATYTRIGIAGKTITLEAPHLAKPLAIMSQLRTPGSAARFVIAQMLIQSAVGDRWVERWFGP